MENPTATASRIPRSQVVFGVVSLAWAALIFYFSTVTFGTDFSRSLLARELSILHLSVSSTTFHHLDTLQRKVAHLIVYGIFAVLLYGAFGGRDSFRRRRTFWCILIAAGYALTDEFHQIFVPGRNASLVDCGIDTVGATVALLLVNQGQRVLRRITGRRIVPMTPEVSGAENPASVARIGVGPATD